MEALFSYLGLSDINLGTMVCVCVSVWGWGWLLRFIPFQVLFCFLLPFLLVIKASLRGVALAPLRGTHFVLSQWLAMCWLARPLSLRILILKERVNLHFCIVSMLADG